MFEFLLVIISIVLIASGVGLLIQPHIGSRTADRYYSDEQRRIMAEAETLHQEAHETYRQMLQESIRLSQEDYYQQRQDVTKKPPRED
ncbi:hypothetical protein KBE88_02710 [Candidatus Saccharibacteria bacterium]|nr:hypothetical protein [Candidatus Saccharibacteria bacterium]